MREELFCSQNLLPLSQKIILMLLLYFGLASFIVVVILFSSLSILFLIPLDKPHVQRAQFPDSSNANNVAYWNLFLMMTCQKTQISNKPL